MTSKICVHCIHCDGRWPTNYNSAPIRRCIHPENAKEIGVDIVTGESLYVFLATTCFEARHNEQLCGTEGKWYTHNYGPDPDKPLPPLEPDRTHRSNSITADDL